MKRLLRASLLTLLSTTAFAAVALDWPQFRGPGGSAKSPDTGLPTTWTNTQGIAWKTQLPGAGSSSPIIVGPYIFLTAYTGYNVPGEDGSPENLKRHVLCLNRADGKIVWTSDFPAKLPEQDKIRDGHGYATSTPVADTKNVFVFFGKSGVFALDQKTGKTVWQADVGDKLNGWGSAASPILHGNLLIINASVESDSLIALDKNTGKEVWRAGGIKESWNTPILVKTPEGATELVVAIFGKVLGFDPDKGTPLWSCETKIPWYMVPSIVADKGIVYCIGGRGGGGSLAIKTGGRGDVGGTHLLWRGKKGSNVSSPIYHEDHVYFASDSSPIVSCTNAKTGEVLYEERLPRADQFYPSPVLADGKLYYVTRAGQVFVVAAKPQFELLGNNKFDERAVFNACPVVIDNRILFRSDKYLYCVGK